MTACDFNRYSSTPCTSKGTWRVMTPSGQSIYFSCHQHIRDSLVVLASAAPLLVEPVFSNWEEKDGRLTSVAAKGDVDV